jgi:hypothetical protein
VEVELPFSPRNAFSMDHKGDSIFFHFHFFSGYKNSTAPKAGYCWLLFWLVAFSEARSMNPDLAIFAGD